MLLPQLFLAAGCVFLGLFPGWATMVFGAALQTSRQGYGEVLAQGFPFDQDQSGIQVGLAGEAVLAPLVVAGVLGLLVVLGMWLMRAGGARRRRVTPWLCGYATEREEHRYVAHSFYGEIHRWTRWFGGGQGPARRSKPISRTTPE
jgi:hypothetical protein